MRADAQRNRARLLDAAVRAFFQDGPEVTLDAIAEDAGVGIGTLYRHFPTREALVEAAYRNELARLCDTVPEMLGHLPPDQATRRWMDLFIDYMTTERDMAGALRAVIASGRNPCGRSRGQLIDAIAALLGAAGRAGTLRRDIEPADVLASLGGLSLTAGAAQRARPAACSTCSWTACATSRAPLTPPGGPGRAVAERGRGRCNPLPAHGRAAAATRH